MNTYICGVGLARPCPPSLPHAVDCASSLYSKVFHPMEVEPFTWIQTIPGIRIFGCNDCTRDLLTTQPNKLNTMNFVYSKDFRMGIILYELFLSNLVINRNLNNLTIGKYL